MKDEQHLNPNGDDESIADALRGLRPATSTIDVRQVFYRAGYQAALAECSKVTQGTPGRREAGKWRWMLAASLLTALVTLPIAYTVGSSSSPSPIASAPSPQTSVSDADASVATASLGVRPASEIVESDSNAVTESPSATPATQTPIKDLRPRQSGLLRWTSRWQDRKRHGESLTAYHGSMELLKRSNRISQPFENIHTAMPDDEVDTQTFPAPLSAGALRTVQDFEQFTFSLENSY